MKKIVILSGKGGVGKSSITASLAIALSKKMKVTAADCDVDASNLALVLGANNNKKDEKKISTNEKPVFDYEKCTGCRKCLETCYLDAIEWDNKKNRPVLKQFGCEGCAACKLICPKEAITMKKVYNATVSTSATDYGITVVSGQLRMGESGSGKIVTEVKKLAEKKAEHEQSDIILIDSAAGIGCPVIASVTGTDFAIGVCEPTPSGFADLRRALEITSCFSIPTAIIINKHNLSPEFTRTIEDYAKKNNHPILTKIPYDKNFQDALINLTPIIEYDKSYRPVFEKIRDTLLELIE